MINKLGMVVTVTIVPGSNPRLCNQLPESFISGTFFWLRVLNLTLGLDFQATHIGLPDGFSFVVSHDLKDFRKRPNGAAKRQT